MCSERLRRYRELINCMPVKDQATISSTDCRKWQRSAKDLQEVLGRFVTRDGARSVFAISRQDLFGLAKKGVSKEFVYAVFVWGFPTGGQGYNFDRLVRGFEQIQKALCEATVSGDICRTKLDNLCASLRGHGIGPAAWTKLLYFLRCKVENHRALILDRKVMRAFQRRLFEDFDEDSDGLANINYDNAPARYPVYLGVMSRVAQDLGVDPDKLEMFLFLFGDSLKSRC